MVSITCLSTPLRCNNVRVFYTICMKKEPAKGGKCKVCGVELPVPAWRVCAMHDNTRKSRPFVPIKAPLRKNFSYFGYKLEISLMNFLNAETLVTDGYTIIGFK